MSNLLESKNILTALIVVAELFFLFIAFILGEGVGLRKARYAVNWRNNYERNFSSMMRGTGHGVFGKVLTVEGDKFAVSGRDGIEHKVIVATSTALRGVSTLSDLHAGDQVGIFGKPNDSGQIEARLVRILR